MIETREYRGSMLHECVSGREQRRATKAEQFRRVQGLLRRRDELRVIERRGIERRELPEPIFMGWERYFMVRADLRRSPEGPYLDRILAHVQRVEACSKDGVLRERDWRRGGKLREVEHRPKAVDACTYWLMTPKMRTYFEPHVTRSRNPRTGKQDIRTTFILAALWKFQSKVRERWKTHETVYTVNVDPEEALIERHLYGPSEWAYRHWARHVGDSYNKWDDYQAPLADLRRAPLVEVGEETQT